jgi:hypothetical protein
MSQRGLGEKVVRLTKKQYPWMADLVEDSKLALDLNTVYGIDTRIPRGSPCPVCKGVRMLCHKTSCPITAKLYSYVRMKQNIDRTNLDGSSPPGVFIGRFGYPNVYAGPMVAPIHGDTEIFDLPEAWFGKSMSEIVDFRFQLVRGEHLVDARTPEDGGKILDETRYLAMADRSVDVELELREKPRKTFVLNDEIQPMGPSARLNFLRSGNFKLDQWIEKAHYDYDLKSAEAVKNLYDRGTPVSKIMKALSVGAFGVRKRRHWSRHVGV